MPYPDRATARLRWGRISAPGATYFTTFCTHSRDPVLTNPENAAVLMEAFDRMQRDADAIFRSATIMPDHVHLLFILGDHLLLGQVHAKLKALARRHGRADWRWQEDAFEHRLRPRESIEDYGFYVFMNPYRAGLCRMSHRWPWWFCPEPKVFRFPGNLNADGTPPDSWLAEAERNEALIASRD
jgi:REP element-mobilizing transposase RayT